MTNNFLTPFLGSAAGGAISNLFRSAPENTLVILKEKPRLLESVVYGMGAGCLLSTAMNGLRGIFNGMRHTPVQNQSSFLSNSAYAFGGGVATLLGATALIGYLNKIQNNEQKKK